MNNRLVVAAFGDRASAEQIERLAAGAEVVAVVFDFGGPAALAAMRDVALAAGAVRCHALDVREEFTRECLLVALSTSADSEEVFSTLARDLVARKLQDVAYLENAVAVLPLDLPSLWRRRQQPATPPVYFKISFDDDGLPVAINGVEMTLAELWESIETITGESALRVLQREQSRTRDLQPA